MLNITGINSNYNCRPVSFKAKQKVDYSELREAMKKLEIKAIEEQEIIPPAKNAAKQVKKKVTKTKSSADTKNNNLQGYISKEGTLYGIFSGNIRIERNKTFEIYGQMKGDIQVDAGAMLKNYGIVKGNVNNNGNVVNYGMIEGNVSGNGVFTNYGINKRGISKN